MNWFDLAGIALTHLRERKRQTVLTALGVAVGTAMLITTIAVSRGSSESVVAKVIDANPNIVISADRVRPLVPESLFAPSDRMVPLVERSVTTTEPVVIKNFSEVSASIAPLRGITSVSPFVLSKVLARNKSRFTACVARGVIPSREGEIAGLRKNVLEKGALEELAATPDGIIAGELLVKKLGVEPHGQIVLVTKNSEEFPVRLVGRFSSGFNARDEREAYVNLALAQRMEGIAGNAATGIGLKTVDVGNASVMARKVEQLSGYKSESWDETSRNVIAFYNRNALITLVLVGFVFIVAGLGVSSVMTTVVLQKLKDIAILRSMGMEGSAVMRLFMLEGLLIGMLGVAVGSPMGYFICKGIASIRYEATTAGAIKSDRIVVAGHASDHLLVSGFGIVVAVLSSWSPARKASKYVPVTILRGQTGG